MNNQILNIFKKINNDNLTKKSLNTYTIIISNLYKNIYGEDDNEFEAYFVIRDFNDIITYLYNNIDNKYTRKTIISAILNLIRYYDNHNDKKIDHIKKLYSDIMYKDNDDINKEKENNKKNDKELNNWIEYDDIIKVFKNMYKKYYEYFYIKDISLNLFDDLQNLIILSFYIFLEPRRLEYIYLKYKNYDKGLDNFIDMDKNIIVLNNYKTSKLKGPITLSINNKIFKDLINNFIGLKKNINIKSDYLFTSLNGNMLAPSQLTKRLNNVFQKKISASMIRKSFLTKIFKNDIDKFKQLENITKNMGNSVNEAMKTYIKK